MNRIGASAENSLQSFVVPQNGAHIVSWIRQNGVYDLSGRVMQLFSEKTRERLAAASHKGSVKREVAQIFKNGEAILQDCCDVYGGKALPFERVRESRRRFFEMVDAFQNGSLLECFDAAELEQMRGGLSDLRGELERCVLKFLELLNQQPDQTAALLDYLKDITGFENRESLHLISTEIERELNRRKPAIQREKSLSTQFFETGAKHLNKLPLIFAMALTFSGMWMSYQNCRV